MKVRATAVAEERSNAIGTLELECTPHGLVVVYLGVGAFSEGYAPAALTSGTRVTVPWAAVLEARVEGEQILPGPRPRRHAPQSLGLDPALDRGARAPAGGQSPALDHLDRCCFRGGGGGDALGREWPHFAPRAGAGFAMLIGGLGALGIIVIGLFADRQVDRVGYEGAGARDAFALELSRFVPSLSRSPVAPLPAPKPFTWPAFEGWLPRTTAAIVITLTACLLGAVLTARWLMSPDRESRETVAASPTDEPRESPRDEPMNVAPRRRVPLPRPASKRRQPPADAQRRRRRSLLVQARELALVERADSEAGAPGALPESGERTSAKAARPRHRRREQWGQRDLREIALSLEFFEQDPPPSNRKFSVAHRAVYFEGPLTPGQAIKWNVEARGSTFDIEKPIPGDLGLDGEGAAPTNLIAELLEANHRPVRLHGAMLLGYFGDPRAREATLKLREAMREDEAPYLDRLVRALGDVRTCDLKVTGGGPVRSVEACVFNTTSESRPKLALRVRGLDAKVNPGEPIAKPPNVATEATFALPAELPAQAGVVVRAKLELAEGSASPVAFEAFADREDLLP